ncbi:unnamed protein product [Symbiodinium sp. CCMP2592]|nr:unnamed protein product [Symbiodinium sp. CCMP2592]
MAGETIMSDGMVPVNATQSLSDLSSDPQLQEYLARVRRRLQQHDETTYGLLRNELRNKPTWVQDVILGLLAHETSSSFYRISKNVQKFKQCLEKYATMMHSEAATQARSLVRELRTADLAALHREASTISGHLQRITESRERNDFASVHQIAAVIQGNARRFSEKLNRLRPLLEELVQKAKELEKEFQQGAQQAEMDGRNLSTRMTWANGIFEWMDEIEGSAGKAVVAIAGGCCVTWLGALVLAGIFSGLGQLVLALGGIAGGACLLGFLGIGVGCATNSAELVRHSAVPAFGGLMVAPGLSAIANGLATMAATILVAVPALQISVIASTIGLALFLVGAVGRRALQSLLASLWHAELSEHETTQAAFQQMADHLRAITELSTVDAKVAAVADALEVLEITAEELATQAQDAQGMFPAAGPGAERALADMRTRMDELEDQLRSGSSSLLPRVTELTSHLMNSEALPDGEAARITMQS